MDELDSEIVRLLRQMHGSVGTTVDLGELVLGSRIEHSAATAGEALVLAQRIGAPAAFARSATSHAATNPT